MWTRKTEALIFCGLIGACAGAAAQTAPVGSSASAAKAATTAGAAGIGQRPGSSTALGDLSPFREIATNTLRIVNTGDFGAAKKRIKDLEISWDKAEPKMKPLAPLEWQALDVAIDRALKEVRAWSATKEAGSSALQALVATIDSTK